MNKKGGRPSKIPETKKQILNYLQKSEIDRSLHQITQNVDATRSTVYKAKDQLIQEEKIRLNRKVAGTPLYTNTE